MSSYCDTSTSTISFSSHLSTENSGNFVDQVLASENIIHVNELIIESSNSNLCKKRIIINARGTKFEVMLQHLAKVPKSRLANLKDLIESNQDPVEIAKLCDDFDLEKNEFYFNKDPQILNLIINFYNPNTKKIHFNLKGTNLCVIQMIEEFKYWNIDYEELFDICCWLRFTKEKEYILEEVKKEEDIIKKLNFEYNYEKSCFPSLKKNIWNLFDNAFSSPLAKIFQLISIILIILPSILLVISTLPQYQPNKDFDLGNLTNLTNLAPLNYQVINHTNSNTIQAKKTNQQTNIVQNLLYVFEIISASWFTIEYLARLWSTPLKKLVFILKPLNIIDILTNIPFYLELIFIKYDGIQNVRNILRLFQVIRIIRLARHSTGLRSLGYTLTRSRNELLLLVVFLGISLLTFSSLAYFFEKDTNPEFNSIISSLWWALITMTSVGYGDMLPMTVPGKIIAGVCAVFGLLIIAMPTAIISSNFSAFYAQNTKMEKAIKRIEQKRKRLERKLKQKLRLERRRSAIYGDKVLKEIQNKFNTKKDFFARLRSLFMGLINQIKTEHTNHIII